MEDREASGAVAFFKAMTQSFGMTLVAGRGRAELIDALTAQAFDFFDGNVAIQSQGLPDLACDKGCPACCTMRVTAAAPEIFLLARTIRRIHETESGMRLDLPGRIAEAHRAGAGLDDQHRIALKRPCPMILRGVCIVHPVRPLACRGHASFDKRACALAAAGRDTAVPISEPHFLVRSLVQNAMQSALREAGYAWRSYELNHALGLALTQDDRTAAWLDGADALAEALVTGVDWEAVGMTFDALQEDD